MARPIFMEGENIFLSPLSKEDNLDEYTNWINDQQTTLFMGSGRSPVSINELENYIDCYNNSKARILYFVFLKKMSKCIDNITLYLIDCRNRSAGVE